MFELKVDEKDVLLEELQKPWQVQERVMDSDMSVLKWVEDLEQRVVSADLHLKVCLDVFSTACFHCNCIEFLVTHVNGRA